MAVLLYHLFCFAALFSYGIYHLVSASRTHLKPNNHSYSARPYHPLPHRRHLVRHLPLYLCIVALSIAAVRHLYSAVFATHDPLVRGGTPVHRFISLQCAVVVLLFLLLALAVLLSHSYPYLLSFSPDVAFLLSALAFALMSSAFARSAASFNPPDDLPGILDSTACKITAVSTVFSLTLAFYPRLFVAELGLAGSISLMGLWSLQTGLSLYADGFIPEGCHRLIDVAAGIEGSTRCELDESRLRVAALLDLAFVIHASFMAVVTVAVYAAVARAVGTGGGGLRQIGTYEALPTSSSGVLSDMDHIQMKSINKNATQD